jgi:hypothetical protein
MFEDVVNLAIAENKRSRETNGMEKTWRKHVSVSSYFKDRCTIHIDIGRATGKTKYIANHATGKDIIITYSSVGKELLLEKGLGIKIFSNLESIQQERGKNSFRDIEFVYIDEPHLFLRNQHCEMVDIYGLFAGSDNPTFVLLGE